MLKTWAAPVWLARSDHFMKSLVLTLVAGAATGFMPAPGQVLPPQALIEGPIAKTARGSIILAASAFVDGTYTGAMVQSIWGPVQVQAVVQRGQIVSLK